MTRKVYIVNKSNHDFSAAEPFGELVFMSEGAFNRYEVNNMLRTFSEALRDSAAEDFLLPCALSTMNMLAAVAFALKHRRLNLLLFRQGDYVEKNLVFD